jgi:hypothetical protein
MSKDSPHCLRCGKTPAQLDEYTLPAKDEDMTPDEYVRDQEGTYNPDNNLFACTECYVELGCPSAPHGWIAGETITGTLR